MWVEILLSSAPVLRQETAVSHYIFKQVLVNYAIAHVEMCTSPFVTPLGLLLLRIIYAAG